MLPLLFEKKRNKFGSGHTGILWQVYIFCRCVNILHRNISHVIMQLDKRLWPLLCAYLINCKIVLNCVVFIKKDSQPLLASLESSVTLKMWSPNSLNRQKTLIGQGLIVQTFIANKKTPDTHIGKTQ